MKSIYLLGVLGLLASGPALAQEVPTCNTGDSCSTALKCSNDPACLGLLKVLMDKKVAAGQASRNMAFGPGSNYEEVKKSCLGRGSEALNTKCKNAVATQICIENGGNNCRVAATPAAAKGPAAGASAGKAQVQRLGGMMIIGKIPQQKK